MYSERTTIVDVVIDEDDVVSLNMTAEELYNASKGGLVLRRHKTRHSDVNMRYYYAALAKATVNSDSYVFVFDNGEEYDGNGSAYPELTSNDGVLNLQVVTVPAPSNDEGKVLTVNEDDELEWSDPSGGGVLVATDTDGTLDKTWQEIHDAFVSGSVRIQLDDDVCGIGIVGHDNHEGYFISTTTNDGYVATSASDYPEHMG